MKHIRELARIVGSIIAVADLTWTAYESIRLSDGENVLIQDAFEFFQKHPEHLPGIYVALAAAGITLLLISTASWIARFYRHFDARTSKNRLRDMVPSLELEMMESREALELLGPLPDTIRVVERQTIGIELTALGICSPQPYAENGIYEGFLAMVIPYARNGDVKAARQAAEKCIAALP